MKAVLSNRIYLSVNKEQTNQLERELTYTIAPRIPSDPPIVFKTFRYVRRRFSFHTNGKRRFNPIRLRIVDKRVVNETEHPDFKFDLRPSQKVVYDEVQDNTIINAWVSWGKTFTGLAIAAKLGQKTLVVTHTTNLRNQWEKRGEKMLWIYSRENR